VVGSITVPWSSWRRSGVKRQTQLALPDQVQSDSAPAKLGQVHPSGTLVRVGAGGGLTTPGSLFTTVASLATQRRWCSSFCCCKGDLYSLSSSSRSSADRVLCGKATSQTLPGTDQVRQSTARLLGGSQGRESGRERGGREIRGSHRKSARVFTGGLFVCPNTCFEVGFG